MPPSRLTRRAVLTGLGLGSLAGCSRSVLDPATGDPAVRHIEHEVSTAAWPGHTSRMIVSLPRTGQATGLVVSLHGKGADAQDTLNLGFDRAIPATGLAIASVDAGDGYYHPRADGSDPGALVLDAVIPTALTLATLPKDAPVGFIGWSMGGYGSLLLASALPKDRVFGVATISAALWTQPGDSAPGAFDNAEDYHRHDVFDAKHELTGVPVWMACGTSDPFYPANVAYVKHRPATRHTFDAGGHTGEYWTAHAGPMLTWLASLA